MPITNKSTRTDIGPQPVKRKIEEPLPPNLQIADPNAPPKPEVKSEVKPEVKSNVVKEDKIGPVQIIRDERGMPTGVIRDGKTFLGLTPNEIEMMAKSQNKLLATPAGAVEAKAVEQAKAQQAQAEQLAALTEETAPTATPTPIDTEKVALSTAKGIVPNVLETAGKFAAIGAGAGLIGGGGVGAVPGAIAGAAIGGGVGLIKSVYSGVTGSIKEQKTEGIQAQVKVFTDGRQNLNRLIALMKADPNNAPVYVADFNTQLGNIRKAHAQLKADTDGDINKFLSVNELKQLQAFEDFFSEGGGRDIYVARKNVALMGGADTGNALLDLQESFVGATE